MILSIGRRGDSNGKVANQPKRELFQHSQSAEPRPGAWGVGKDVHVIVWSTNVLPTDRSGLYDPVTFNDPHKYRFCRYLSELPGIRSVTMACPGRSLMRDVGDGHGVRVVRVPVPENHLAIAALYFNLQLCMHMLRPGRQVSYFYDDGEAIPFVLPLLLSRLRGFETILDYRNPPKVVRFIESLRRRKALVFLAELLACKFASRVVVLSPSCADTVTKHYGRHPAIVPSVVSAAFFHKPDLVLGPSGCLRFAYWGALDRNRKLDQLVLGFVDASNIDPSTPRELVLVGDGNDRERLAELSSTSASCRVTFEPWRTEPELLRILETTTVSVIAIPASNYQFIASSPLKFVEALALGRPILASDIPVMGMVATRGIGVVAKHDRESYCEAFLSFTEPAIKRFVRNLDEYPERADAFLPNNAFAQVRGWLTLEPVHGRTARGGSG